MTKFNIGDIVIKERGKKPGIVTQVQLYGYNDYYDGYNDYYECKYVHNGRIFESYGIYLKLYDGETEMATKTETLYSFTVDGKTSYGIHIGTNSKSQYLIEEKETGKIHVLDKNYLEEVLPYTFSATMSGSETHYIGTPGTVSKGDVLLYTGSSTPQIAVVTEIDTKSKSARSKFNGVKLVTTEL